MRPLLIILYCGLAGCAGGTGAITGDTDDVDLAETSGTSSGADFPVTISASGPGSSTASDGGTGQPEGSATATATESETGAVPTDASTGEQQQEDSTSGRGPTSTGGASETETGSDASSTGAAGETGEVLPIDLSGYAIVQANSARAFVLPVGTLVAPGGGVILGRDATQSAFEAHWGVSLGSNVTYIDTAGAFPLVNGDETFTLRDADDALVDGPSPALAVGETAVREVEANGAIGAWSVTSAGEATPGATPPIEGDAATPTPYLVRASDALGNGNFVYEFVEVAIAFRAP